jgi:hypothetical protein
LRAIRDKKIQLFLQEAVKSSPMISQIIAEVSSQSSAKLKLILRQDQVKPARGFTKICGRFPEINVDSMRTRPFCRMNRQLVYVDAKRLNSPMYWKTLKVFAQHLRME